MLGRMTTIKTLATLMEENPDKYDEYLATLTPRTSAIQTQKLWFAMTSVSCDLMTRD